MGDEAVGKESLTIMEASEVRMDQGHHEVEISFGGEGDLHKHFIFCKKNTGHKKFIPADKFTLENLPPEYRTDQGLGCLLRSLVGLAVRIAVSHTSHGRPDFVPGTSAPYPFSNYRGRSNFTRTGSGAVIKVDKYTDRSCPCAVCQDSKEPCKKWGRVIIVTAAHVVFDTEEGKHTRCHFFYDNASMALKSCPSLAGAWRVDTDVSLDHSVLKYLTHDMDLVDKLDELVRTYMKQCSLVWNKYKPDMDAKSYGVYLNKQFVWCRRLVNYWTDVNGQYRADTSYDDSNKEKTDDHGKYLADQLKFWQGKFDNVCKLREEHGCVDSESPADDATDVEWPESPHSLTVVVSHPHGCSKMVTIGEIVDRKEELDSLDVAVSTYLYNAPTCPGSSGAPVYVLGRWWRSGCDHPHSGSFQTGGPHSQVNRSAGGRDY